MMTMEQLEEDYGRVESAIRFIETEALRQPSLGEIAEVGGTERVPFPETLQPLGRASARSASSSS